MSDIDFLNLAISIDRSDPLAWEAVAPIFAQAYAKALGQDTPDPS